MARRRKDFTKNEVLTAMSKTRSVKAAARYLGCSYQHLKPIMLSYKDESTGKSLFEIHKNQCGKGIPKFSILSKHPDPALKDIIEGRVDCSLFPVDKIKWRLIQEGYIAEKCDVCGFEERRVLDHKIPLILYFKDKNKRNFQLENLQLLCYNHYFLTVGNIFNNSDLTQLENFTDQYKTTDSIELELDEYHFERLRELGLYEPLEKKDDDLLSYTN